MKTLHYFLFLVFAFLLQSSNIIASSSAGIKNSRNFEQKNIIYLQLVNHFEQRGGNGNFYSNPEFAIGFDKKLFGIGMSHFFLGLKTGYYFETVLTGRNYDHTYQRPFVGLYPSYIFAPTKRFKIQVAAAWDIIILKHNEFEESTWWFMGIEPSVQFYPLNNLYISIGATAGEFPGFEPIATFKKAFVKAGFCF